MTKEKQQRNKLIDFILDFASDEIESVKDALKLARMTNQELKENIKSIKEYYKREHKTII
jgi:flagellar biosynthesis chaperone FliJ